MVKRDILRPSLWLSLHISCCICEKEWFLNLGDHVFDYFNLRQENRTSHSTRLSLNITSFKSIKASDGALLNTEKQHLKNTNHYNYLYY